MPAILLAAPIMTVASFILRKGSVKAAKKYGPKLIKKAKDYIDKNKLILSGNKVIKPPKGSITKIKGGKGGPSKVKSNKKDSFDEQLKKKEGAKNFNKNNKDATTTNKAPKAYVDKFGNPHRTKAGADRASKLNNNPRSPKNKKKNNKKKNKDDKKLVENVNKTPIVGSKIKKAAKIGAGIVLGGLAINQGSKILDNIGNTSGSGPSNFAAAFKKARKEKGPDSTFTYKGKQYSTVTIDQYKKAGFNSLREYLNAKKKK